jgi:hypothetical protein
MIEAETDALRRAERTMRAEPNADNVLAYLWACHREGKHGPLIDVVLWTARLGGKRATKFRRAYRVKLLPGRWRADVIQFFVAGRGVQRFSGTWVWQQSPTSRTVRERARWHYSTSIRAVTFEEFADQIRKRFVMLRELDPAFAWTKSKRLGKKTKRPRRARNP